MKKLYIIDGVYYLFRSYFAIQKMTNPKGESTNALFGFIRSVQKIIKDFKPTYLVCVFDGEENKKSRQAIYEDYKGHRGPMPEDLFPQLERALEFCELAGIPTLQIPGVEADDTIGSLAKWAAKNKTEVLICSNDKDLCQVVSPHIQMINTYKDNLVLDEKGVEEFHGVRPDQIVDYLAMMGDKADNIPGIPGFGPKTAASVLHEGGTIEEIIKNPERVKNEKRRNAILDNKKQLLISKQLATLDLDLKFPKKESLFEISAPDLDGLTALYQEMRFLSLLKDLPAPPEKEVKEIAAKRGKEDYRLVNDEAHFAKLLEILRSADEVAFDTETTSLKPLEAEMVGLGFCIEEGITYYVPLNGNLDGERVLAALKPIFEDPKRGFYGHNIKYDLHILANYDVEIANIAFDTMIASYLLNPQNSRHGLDQITLEIYNKKKTPISALIGTGKKQKSMWDVPIETVSDYCGEDVDYTFRLKQLFEEELKEAKLDRVFEEIELPLVPVLLDMERHGMYVDPTQFKHMSHELTKEIESLEREIHDLAGVKFNIKSPKQLSEVLFDRLEIKTRSRKKSTRADILEGLKDEYPIAGKILLYRMVEKLRSTYVDALPTQINKETKRIHCTFNQTGTATGRLACQDPNLQNIPIRRPEGKKIREAFQPEKSSYRYLSADYSQIELRLMAHLSEEPALIKAFKHGEDIHVVTASQVFDVPIAKVTKEMRQQAKAVNFGIIYGQQAYGLSQQLSLDIKEAAKFIGTYFENYPNVKKFLDDCKTKAHKTGMAITMLGRRRPIPDIHSKNVMIRSAAERLAINTPLQGSQADIIKMAMIEIHEALLEKDLGSMILQIHDELIFEAPAGKIKELSKLVKSKMEGIIELKVPLTVNVSVGKNWGEC